MTNCATSKSFTSTTITDSVCTSAASEIVASSPRHNLTEQISDKPCEEKADNSKPVVDDSQTCTEENWKHNTKENNLEPSMQESKDSAPEDVTSQETTSDDADVTKTEEMTSENTTVITSQETNSNNGKMMKAEETTSENLTISQETTSDNSNVIQAGHMIRSETSNVITTQESNLDDLDVIKPQEMNSENSNLITSQQNTPGNSNVYDSEDSVTKEEVDSSTRRDETASEQNSTLASEEVNTENDGGKSMNDTSKCDGATSVTNDCVNDDTTGNDKQENSKQEEDVVVPEEERLGSGVEKTDSLDETAQEVTAMETDVVSSSASSKQKCEEDVKNEKNEESAMQVDNVVQNGVSEAMSHGELVLRRAS